MHFLKCQQSIKKIQYAKSRVPDTKKGKAKGNKNNNKKSYNVLKRDNGRYCWMAIRRMK